MAEQRLKEEQATLIGFDTELKSLEGVIKARKNTMDECELGIGNVDHRIHTLQKEKLTAQNRMELLEKTHEWIAHDKQYVVHTSYVSIGHLACISDATPCLINCCRQFGQPNTQYDFSTGDIDQLRANAQELEKSQGAIKKKIKPKVMNTIETYGFLFFPPLRNERNHNHCQSRKTRSYIAEDAYYSKEGQGEN